MCRRAGGTGLYSGCLGDRGLLPFRTSLGVRTGHFAAKLASAGAGSIRVLGNYVIPLTKSCGDSTKVMLSTNLAKASSEMLLIEGIWNDLGRQGRRDMERCGETRRERRIVWRFGRRGCYRHSLRCFLPTSFCRENRGLLRNVNHRLSDSWVVGSAHMVATNSRGSWKKLGAAIPENK